MYVAEQTDATTNTKTNEAYVSNKVIATGLSANTVYYYSYEKEDGTYTEPAEYATKSTNNYSFIFVGDPQIGSSNELKGSDTAEFYQAQSDAVRNDSFNWNTTLNEAMDKTGGNASFVVSAGDQIQTTKKKSPGKSEMTSEIEYTGYLSPDVLKSFLLQQLLETMTQIMQTTHIILIHQTAATWVLTELLVEIIISHMETLCL